MIDGEVSVETAIEVLREQGVGVVVDGDSVKISSSDAAPEVMIWRAGTTISRRTIEYLKRKLGVDVRNFLNEATRTSGMIPPAIQADEKKTA